MKTKMPSPMLRPSVTAALQWFLITLDISGKLRRDHPSGINVEQPEQFQPPQTRKRRSKDRDEKSTPTRKVGGVVIYKYHYMTLSAQVRERHGLDPYYSQ